MPEITLNKIVILSKKPQILTKTGRMAQDNMLPPKIANKAKKNNRKIYIITPICY